MPVTITLARVLKSDKQLEIVLSLLEVFKTVLVSEPSNVLYDVSLAPIKTILVAELYRLNSPALVVITSFLLIKRINGIVSHGCLQLRQQCRVRDR